MSRSLRTPLLASAALLISFGAVSAQEPDGATATTDAPAASSETAAEEPAVDEDNMADLLNSQQQIKQDVTLTRSVDGKVIESRTETVVYSMDDPLRATEAGLSPLEKLKAEFDSEALTRKEAIEEAKSDFIIADLDRDNDMSADEFVFLVKGWENAEITGSGRGRFVDPFFHVNEAEAAIEHEKQAREKFNAMAGVTEGVAVSINRKVFQRSVLDEFEAHDLDKNEILQGDELLNFRAAVRGEAIPSGELR